MEVCIHTSLVTGWKLKQETAKVREHVGPKKREAHCSRSADFISGATTLHMLCWGGDNDGEGQ